MHLLSTLFKPPFEPGGLNIWQKNSSGPTSALIWVNVIVLWMELFWWKVRGSVACGAWKSLICKILWWLQRGFNYLFIFWSDGNCAIDLHLFLSSCVFIFVCAFGFAFPSSAGPAVGRTSDCLDGHYHRWWKWKVCDHSDSFWHSANCVVGIIACFIYSEVSGHLEWKLFRNTLWMCWFSLLSVFNLLYWKVFQFFDHESVVEFFSITWHKNSCMTE